MRKLFYHFNLDGGQSRQANDGVCIVMHAKKRDFAIVKYYRNARRYLCCQSTCEEVNLNKLMSNE